MESLYQEFNNRDIEVIIDDVKGSIGEKIRNAKILGVPYIAIMGNNTVYIFFRAHSNNFEKYISKNT